MLIDLAKLYDLTGQVAIVTGGGRGMGEGIARYLAGVGATVIVADIHEQNAEDVAAAIRVEGGKASAWTVDMADEAQIVAMVAAVRHAEGRIDMLVNNAGWQDRAYIEDTSGEFWDHILDTNLRGPAMASREVVKVMRGDGTQGRIVNIASNSGFHAMAASLFAYSTSKAGVVGLTRATALEVVKDGIRVNCVCPGNVTTPGQALATGPDFPPEQLARFMPPIGRTGTAGDVAAAVLYLVSPASSFITGQALIVDGGMLSC